MTIKGCQDSFDLYVIQPSSRMQLRISCSREARRAPHYRLDRRLAAWEGDCYQPREINPNRNVAMADPKSSKLKARLPRGLIDSGPAEIAATRRMMETIRKVYELYGFEPVETPAIEYTDALGKFLP